MIYFLASLSQGLAKLFSSVFRSRKKFFFLLPKIRPSLPRNAARDLPKKPIDKQHSAKNLPALFKNNLALYSS